MSNKFFMVGSDPEGFLRDRENRLVSAIGVVPGSKSDPFKTKHGSIQHDNILAEFNSIPAASLSDFINNHKLIIRDLEEVLTPLNLTLDFVASALADQGLLSDPLAIRAGCEPDYNAWTLSENIPPDYISTNVRAAGGHLHISFDQAVNSPENRVKFVKALDLVLGVPSVIFDKDKERRKLYGKAGAYRPKDTNVNDPYDGVEYRTLSNFWLKSEELMAFVYQGVEQVYNDLDNMAAKAEYFKADILKAIGSGHRSKAINLCEEAGINYAI